MASLLFLLMKKPNFIKKPKPKKQIPFSFVLDALERVITEIKPMFGCYAIYVGPKIALILRDREDNPQDNGVWLATSAEHHSSLANEFSSMRSIEIFGPGPTSWQVLPANSHDFEEAVDRACQLVLRGDQRIGKVPKPKKIKKPKISGQTLKKSKSRSD
ncbi:MAG: hypothetical protein AABZ55_13800 [Bdellovibrionota bacterium]